MDNNKYIQTHNIFSKNSNNYTILNLKKCKINNILIIFFIYLSY